MIRQMRSSGFGVQEDGVCYWGCRPEAARGTPVQGLRIRREGAGFSARLRARIAP
jgi:hypothetical protein